MLISSHDDGQQATHADEANMRINLLPLIFVACLVLAACGGSESARDSGSGRPPTDTPSSPETPNAPPTGPTTPESPVTPEDPGGGSTPESPTTSPYQAPDARFSSPLAMAADGSGNMYVAGDGTVRMITPSGAVSTLAGAPDQFGTPPAGGSDGIGSAARFNVATGLAAAPDGNLYVADTFANTGKIRKITPEGVVTTVHAGVFSLGIASDASGGIHFSDNFNLRVTSISPDGTVSHSARIGAGPRGLAADASGNLYVLNTGQVYRPLGQTTFSCTIEKMETSGKIVTLAGRLAAREFDSTCGHEDGVGPAARIGRDAQGIVVDSDGVVYFTDTASHTVRRLSPDGTVTTIAGVAEEPGHADGTGMAARFNRPTGITLGADGNLYVADTENQVIRRVTPAGLVTTVAGKAGEAGTVDTP